MRTNRLHGLVVVFLSIFLIVFFVSSVDLEATSSVEAKFGKALSEVLLHWQLMVLNGPSYARDSGLDSSLVALQESLEALDSPDSIYDRVSPLRKKFESAKTEDVWTYQFGFWNFAQEDSTVSLSGVKRDEDILVDGNGEDESNSGRLGFRYLKFSDSEDRAVIGAGEKLTTPLSESYTLEFWIRIREKSAENVVSSGSWNLRLNDNLPVLEGSSGNTVLEGREIPLNYWTHIALIREGEKVKLYQNGNKVKESLFSGSLNISDEIVFGKGLVGDVDELRINDSSVKPEYLNFDRPIDYLIGFPILGWTQNRFGPEELWHFYAGLLISNLSLKRDNDRYSVSSEDASRVAEFLLTEDEEKLKLPSDLPASTVENIEELKELEDNGELSKEEEKEIGQFIESLTNYLDLG